MYVGVGPPPPPGTAGRAAPAQTPLPARRPRRGRGGVGQMGFRAIPPPQSNFLPAKLCIASAVFCHLGRASPRHTLRPVSFVLSAVCPMAALIPLHVPPPSRGGGWGRHRCMPRTWLRGAVDCTGACTAPHAPLVGGIEDGRRGRP